MKGRRKWPGIIILWVLGYALSAWQEKSKLIFNEYSVKKEMATHTEGDGSDPWDSHSDPWAAAAAAAESM